MDQGLMEYREGQERAWMQKSFDRALGSTFVMSCNELSL